MLVDNISYDKKVEVIWAGEDENWQTLPAQMHSAVGDKEYWQAQVTIYPTKTKNLPGNIQFVLRYRTLGQEYWDNNQGSDYASQADSGVKLAYTLPLLNIGFPDKLRDNQKVVPVTVAINRSLIADKVTLHWSTDNWQSTQTTPCYLQTNHWEKEHTSNARNPNQYGIQIWKGWLRIGNAFGVQYSIACESKGETHWDNNYGLNYSHSHKPLNILILNLHCYQEDDQAAKFSQIAKAIDDQKVDVACLQEVAELWNDGAGDWNSNAAKIINEHLKTPYHLYTDWSHLGFDKYREGVAILSKYPLLEKEARYVSNSHDPFHIHTRKVVKAQINVPYIGLVNVFSAHLSWWEDGFEEQFNRLAEWAESQQSPDIKATLLCGDFNIMAGSAGYKLVVDTHHYGDQYLAINSPKWPEETVKVNDPYWQNHLADDYRIDFIFMKAGHALKVATGRVLFTEQDYGRVSDHCGYLMAFEPK